MSRAHVGTIGLSEEARGTLRQLAQFGRLKTKGNGQTIGAPSTTERREIHRESASRRNQTKNKTVLRTASRRNQTKNKTVLRTASRRNQTKNKTVLRTTSGNRHGNRRRWWLLYKCSQLGPISCSATLGNKSKNKTLACQPILPSRTGQRYKQFHQRREQGPRCCSRSDRERCRIRDRSQKPGNQEQTHSSSNRASVPVLSWRSSVAIHVACPRPSVGSEPPQSGCPRGSPRKPGPRCRCTSIAAPMIRSVNASCSRAIFVSPAFLVSSSNRSIRLRLPWGGRLLSWGQKSRTKTRGNAQVHQGQVFIAPPSCTRSIAARPWYCPGHAPLQPIDDHARRGDRQPVTPLAGEDPGTLIKRLRQPDARRIVMAQGAIATTASPCSRA